MFPLEKFFSIASICKRSETEEKKIIKFINKSQFNIIKNIAKKKNLMVIFIWGKLNFVF